MEFDKWFRGQPEEKELIGRDLEHEVCGLRREIEKKISVEGGYDLGMKITRKTPAGTEEWQLEMDENNVIIAVTSYSGNSFKRTETGSFNIGYEIHEPSASLLIEEVDKKNNTAVTQPPSINKRSTIDSIRNLIYEFPLKTTFPPSHKS